jgi:hypothetical protein
MSLFDRLLGGVKETLLMKDDLARLKEITKEMMLELRDHEARLIRIETLIEVAQGKLMRLPAPRKPKK